MNKAGDWNRGWDKDWNRDWNGDRNRDWNRSRSRASDMDLKQEGQRKGKDLLKKAVYWKKAAVCAFVLVFLLSACGASTAKSESAAADQYAINAPREAGGAAYNEAVTEKAYSSSYSEDSYDAGGYGEWNEEAEEQAVDAPMAAAESEEGGSSVSTEASAGTGGDAEQADLQSPNRKIVYTGNVSLQSLEYDKSSQSIHDKIKQSGGFIESEDTYNEDPYWYYSSRTGAAANKTRRNLNITARIPAEKFDGFMRSLEEDGQVINTSVNAQNISVAYATHDASRKALEIEKGRLLEMMEKAETVEEMITVERRLTQVERELGDEMTQLSAMDRDVDFSTVYISLQEVFEYSEQVVEISYAERLQRAFGRAIESFVTFWQDVLLWLAETFPFLIMWGIVIFIAAKLVRRSRRRRAEKRAKMEEERLKAMQAGGVYKADTPGAYGTQPGADKTGGLKGVFRRRGNAKQPAPGPDAAGDAAQKTSAETQAQPVQPSPDDEKPEDRKDFPEQTGSGQTESGQREPEQTEPDQTK